MASYRLKTLGPISLYIVTEKHTNIIEYNNDCDDMKKHGYVLLAESVDPASLRKFALYIKYKEKEE